MKFEANNTATLYEYVDHDSEEQVELFKLENNGAVENQRFQLTLYSGRNDLSITFTRSELKKLAQDLLEMSEQ